MIAEDTRALAKLFEEAGGVLSDVQINAAVFMGFDRAWAELRALEREGCCRATDGYWKMIS